MGAYMDNDFAKWDKTVTEKAHLKFCKLYLGVNRKASNLASRGELGRYPLQISILKRILRYIKNICQLPDSCIAKQVFHYSKELYMNNNESFYSNVINVLKRYLPELDDTMDLETFTKDTIIDSFIKKSVKDNYVSFWNDQVRNSRKLSFYYTFKKNYKMEEYLNTIKDPSQRRMFAKFRISNHKLLIEYGRYRNIPREERYCKLCGTQKVEDEFHFAFECQNYENIRNDSSNILKNIFQMTLVTESKQNLLSHVISSTDSVLIDLFSKFIAKYFNIRDKSLQTRDTN
ncbi:Hypothetical predicted protein [Paramuricea clavata]|uniref:Uncharacterized protein n=1 Tax=Paramuricea clavata TaxID=317549 RepID=A0A6S7JXU3_PARCT|nr:Hypothetical predicted protein [Paramuricea clavata]